MTTSNALWVLLSIIPVGQTPAPAAVLVAPTEQMPVRPGALVQTQAEQAASEPLPTPDAQQAFAPTLTPMQDFWRRVYGGAEYLHWWLREARLPDLLTTSSPSAGGVLGTGDTSVLFGGDRSAGNTQFNGARVTLGYWFALGRFGIEGDLLFLPSVNSTFTAASNGSTLLALPYTNAVTGLPASTIIAGPTPGGVLSGTFTGYTATQLYGQQVNFVMLIAGDGTDMRLDYLGGIRLLEMRDTFDQTSISQNAAGVTTLDLHDQFYTHSTFYGLTYGLRGTLNRGPFSLQIRGLGAIGGTDQQVQASGTNFGVPPGMYVQSSNLGDINRTRFDMVYETGFNLGWQATSWLKVYAGYTFLWWVNPIRAGDQVDTTLNLTAAGPVRPVVPFKQDSLTVQGLNVGLAIRW